MELVDTLDSKSNVARRVGSIPTLSTSKNLNYLILNRLRFFLLLLINNLSYFSVLNYINPMILMFMHLKKTFLIAFVFLIATSLYSQTEFKKGVFITDTNDKVECFIKSMDWKSNPTEFKYKLTENGEIKTGFIEGVKAFEIYDISKYTRATVNIDRSSSNLNKLTTDKNPIFKEEQLFLKVIIESEASLYYYEDGNLKRFFYNLENEKIEQLVYKEYLFEADLINENNHYKQQLLNSLKCKDISMNSIKSLSYTIKDLSKLFEKYNACVGGELVNFEKKEERDLFNFRAKLGLGRASLSIKNSVDPDQNADFDNEILFRFGGELEMILPFNNDKWAIVIEPSYQSYSSKTEVDIRYPGENQADTYTYEASYSTIELPIGLRHYFFLNEDSKIFVNAFYTYFHTLDSSMKIRYGTELDVEKGGLLSIGLGYSYKKLSAEFRLENSRQILGQYRYWDSNYKQVTLLFGYQLF